MKILGHRGITNGGNTLFENSVPAFEYALKHCDGIETDACLSSDGEIFLIHETIKDSKYSIADYLDSKSNKILADRRLDMLTSTEISTLKLKNGEKIPTLEEVIALFTDKHNKILNIELKSNNVEKSLISKLKTALKNKLISEDQIILSSFNHKQLAKMQKELPNLKIGALFTSINDKHNNIYPWLNNSEKYQKCNMQNIAKIVNNANYLVLPYSDITKNLLHDIKFNYPEIKIIVWLASGDKSFNLQNFQDEFSENISGIIINDPKQTESMIYDLAIIGGGINGCGIARDASGRGLKVYLCDKSGIGSETSASSTKLIHGGLRYLENYEFKLVRKALKEREKLSKIAPHIINEATFILPHQKHLRPKWMIKLGVCLYDILSSPSKFAKSKSISLTNTEFGKPLKDNITHGFSYADCRVNDHRITVLNALDAQNNGARIEPYTKCNKAKAVNGVWHISSEKGEIRAKVLINATGPWADSFANTQNINYDERSLKHIKGSHIVVPKIFEHESCYIFQDKNKRIVFALPFEKNFTLIGTTEETVEKADNPECSRNEQEYLCSVINEYFKENISTNDIVWSYAGVRPILDEKSSNNRTASRDYTLDIAEQENAPYLNIWGGKLTTYRTLAEKALEKLTPYHPKLVKNIGWTAQKPLPGGEINPNKLQKQLIKEFPFIDSSIIERYSHSYGSLCFKFLNGIKNEASLGKHFGHGLYQVEIDYLINNEWAKTADDILWKKTKLGLLFANKEVSALIKYIA